MNAVRGAREQSVDADGAPKLRAGPGRLEAGQFYAASDGVPEALVRARQCLSHHPPDPLTEQEIIERAARRPGRLRLGAGGQPQRREHSGEAS